jgi:uncharacterized protein (DUF58 family)
MSVEFCDYRPYGVGDDLRYVDWNIYGRLDRLYLKLFLDEEDLCLHLLVDASASMDYGEPTKFDFAVRLAAALGFVGLVNLERVGAGILRERVAQGWLPVRGRSQFLPLAEFLQGLRPHGTTGLNEGLTAYARQARDPGVAVMISDLMDPSGYQSGIRALLERRFEVHVVHVLAPEEMDPRFSGDLRLLDAETGEIQELTLDGDALRQYRRRLAQFLSQVEAFSHANEVTYHRVTTDAPIQEFMLTELKGVLLA